MEKKFLESFMKINCKKSLQLKKQPKENAINYMSKKKIMIISLIAG